MAKTATGKFAIGQCQRCGGKARYVDLVADGNTPGLRVHPECRDVKHPAETPFTAEDGIALAHPAPDLDTAAAGGGDGATLVDNLMPLTGGYFGGAT